LPFHPVPVRLGVTDKEMLVKRGSGEESSPRVINIRDMFTDKI